MKKQSANTSEIPVRKTKVKMIVRDEPLPAMVYGLDGICELFNCSRTTAFRLYHGVIADACAIQGHKIIVNTRKALELFGVNDIHVEK